jgi:hypothetical protein
MVEFRDLAVYNLRHRNFNLKYLFYFIILKNVEGYERER